MSTIFDIAQVTVDDNLFDITGVSIGFSTTFPIVTTDSIIVEVPGLQGPPGLQNVYAQTANPATQYGWGVEETGYIWLQT